MLKGSMAQSHRDALWKGVSKLSTEVRQVGKLGGEKRVAFFFLKKINKLVLIFFLKD